MRPSQNDASTAIFRLLSQQLPLSRTDTDSIDSNELEGGEGCYHSWKGSMGVEPKKGFDHCGPQKQCRDLCSVFSAGEAVLLLHFEYVSTTLQLLYPAIV
jgi:hypothetical protein